MFDSAIYVSTIKERSMIASKRSCKAKSTEVVGLKKTDAPEIMGGVLNE